MTELRLERIGEVLGIEAARQGVGLTDMLRLFEGYEMAFWWQGLPSLEMVFELASVVEPSSYGRCRVTPVTFRNSNAGLAPELVPVQLEKLFDALKDDRVEHREFIREFLVIHPFNDGNGRVAWILQNYLEGSLGNPDPLWGYQWQR